MIECHLVLCPVIYGRVSSSAIPPLSPNPSPGKTRHPPNKVLSITLENRAHSGKPVALHIRYNTHNTLKNTHYLYLRFNCIGFTIFVFSYSHRLDLLSSLPTVFEPLYTNSTTLLNIFQY